MTETTENCPTTQTTTTISRGISRVLIPSTTKLSSRRSELVLPQIIRSTAQEIVIAGLPYISTRDVNDCAISAICHDFQHYYRDGDYIGHTGINEKHEAKEPLRNNYVRIAFSYTMLYKKGLLFVNLMRNNADNPVTLRKIDPAQAFKMHIKPKNLRKYGDDAYIASPMTTGEIRYYENLFSVQCAQEIQHHLDRTYLKALYAECKTGEQIEPDYYNKQSLHKLYLSPEIAD